MVARDSARFPAVKNGEEFSVHFFLFAGMWQFHRNVRPYSTNGCRKIRDTISSLALRLRAFYGDLGSLSRLSSALKGF